MIKHVVLYKLKDNSKKAKQELVDTFLSMKGKIAELIEISAGYDILDSERSFDVVLECVFHSFDSMAVYKAHPVHLPVMAYVKERVVKSHSVDYIK